MLRRAALYLATGSAVAVLFSIAVSQILLVAATLTLLVAREPLQFPPLKVPLTLFFVWTVLAVLLSSDPAAGIPQIRKFFVFLLPLVLYTTLRGVEDGKRLVVLWAGFAAVSGLWSFVQFWSKRSEALGRGWDFYLHYVANRATGFMSHWMTFSAEQMLAGLAIAALLLFGAVTGRVKLLLVAALCIIGGSIVISWTRSVWLATAIAGLYLVAVSRPKWLLALPVVLVAAGVVAPGSVRDRAVSIYQPHGQVDSNDHRRVTFFTGLEMVKAHPWFGLGPEIVGRDFNRYVPPEIPRPLPAGFYGHLHNIYLQYSAERGIPALIAMLVFIGKVLFDLAMAARRLPAQARLHRAALHAAVAGVLAVLIEGFFEMNLGDTEVLTMFLALVAVGYVARREAAVA